MFFEKEFSLSYANSCLSVNPYSNTAICICLRAHSIFLFIFYLQKQNNTISFGYSIQDFAKSVDKYNQNKCYFKIIWEDMGNSYFEIKVL